MNDKPIIINALTDGSNDLDLEALLRQVDAEIIRLKEEREPRQYQLSIDNYQPVVEPRLIPVKSMRVLRHSVFETRNQRKRRHRKVRGK